ncbi:MAG: ABC transporter ATP-binding protein [Anaerolineae bacterium]|nr:ABC transporter ATP-binding protein [Anaerolineae bacterium]
MDIPVREYWRLLRRYLLAQRGAALSMAVLLLASTGLGLVAPQIVRRFIDAALGGVALPLLTRTAVAFFLVRLAHEALSLLARYRVADVARTATNALRVDLVSHLVRLDLDFHKAHPPGELIERMDSDVDALAGFLSSFAIDLVGSALLLAGILIAVTVEDVALGVLFVVFALLALALLAWVHRFAPPHWRAEREHSARFWGFLGEMLTATEDIQSCGAAQYALRRFTRRLHRWRPVVLRASLWGMIWLAGEAVYIAGNALTWGVGGPMVHSGVLSLGTLYMIAYYVDMLVYGSLQDIEYQLQDLQHAQASIVRVQELFGATSALVDGTAALPPGALSVTFDHVSFAYRDRTPRVDNQDSPAGPDAADPGSSDPVLRDLSFRLPAGRVLGLLGRTGSGKTTIARLLFRLYDPQEGAIRLGGVDLRRQKIDALRARIGLVTQDVQLFQASLRDNLTFFDPAVSDEALIATLEALGLAQWSARLPQGLDAPITGETLSAGEAQLVALARVFLQDPDLVVLDEASSRLDPATEHLLGQALDRLLRGRSAVIIAHRLQTVDRADEILILEGGEAIEHGSRRQLAADPGSHFARLLRTGIEEALA